MSREHPSSLIEWEVEVRRRWLTLPEVKMTVTWIGPRKLSAPAPSQGSAAGNTGANPELRPGRATKLPYSGDLLIEGGVAYFRVTNDRSPFDHNFVVFPADGVSRDSRMVVGILGGVTGHTPYAGIHIITWERDQALAESILRSGSPALNYAFFHHAYSHAVFGAPATPARH